MKEIGGYFELEKLVHNEYYHELISLNTARNALIYLCRVRNIKKLWIPYFLCDSVTGVCDREGIKYDFYHINSNFIPDFSEKLSDGEYLYVVNYYGQISNNQIIQYQKKYKRIIVDNVQAFFQKPIPNIDTIYSCRKFFGAPDGAYLSTDAPKLELETDISMERMKHLLGRYEGESATEYYSDFVKNDTLFETLPLLKMSSLTHNIMGAVDYHSVIKRRNDNWLFLHQMLKEYNTLDLNEPYGPYMYPFYCRDGLIIKKKMAEHKIYIPTLWPNVLSLENEKLERDYAANILPLPIDQRYDVDSLLEMVEILKTCIGK